MEMFEKVEKLRDRANVSFEEARAALEASDGDLLDAMVLLEKQGKAKQPEQSTYSTSYEEQKQFTSVEEKVKEQSGNDNVFVAIRSFIRGFTDKCRGNYFCVTRKEEVKIKIPALLFVVLLIAFWQVTIPVLIIMLFFGCQYSFTGKDELKEANEIMDRASDFAQQVKTSFQEKAAAAKTADAAEENGAAKETNEAAETDI